MGILSLISVKTRGSKHKKHTLTPKK